MRRKFLSFLVILVLLVAQLAAFVPCAYAQSTVGTSTYAFPVSYPHQRKGFYANPRFWVFYSDGANMVYKTSTDGTTWSSATTVRACANGYMFSVWFGGTYFHYAYAAFGTSIYYRRGLPNSNGTTTWSADEQTISITYNKAYYPFVSTDSDGYVWIGYADVTGTSCYPYVIKSQYNNGSWGTTPAGFPYQLSTTASGSYGIPNWRISIIPLTVLKMVAIYAYNGITARVQSWNGSAWGAEAATASTTYSIYHCAVAQGDDVHLTFLKSDVVDKVWIIYVKYTYSTNSFGAETTLAEVASSNPSAPVISIDNSNNLYVFRLGPTAKHIYYHKWNGTSWESAVDWITEATEFTRYDTLSCFYKQYGNYIGLAYGTKASSPYNVRFAYLTFAAAKAWYDVSTWQFDLLTRQWINTPTWMAQYNFTVNPIADSDVHSVDPDTNHGTNTTLRVMGESINIRSFLNFSFADLPSDANVTSVKLRLYAYIVLGNPTQNASRVVGTWTETGITWNNQPTVNFTNSILKSGLTGTAGYREYDITNMFMDAMQLGNNISVRIHDIHEGGMIESDLYAYSREAALNKPELVINYEKLSTQISFYLQTSMWSSGTSWLFDFGTKMWVDAATWTYNLVTMAWQNISWIFYLGTSIWTDIAIWGASLVAMMWNDVATYTFNLLSMAWHDLTWLFTLLPALPEWVNVALWTLILQPQSRSGLLLICIAIGIILSLGFVRLLAVRKRKTTQTTAEMLYRLSYRIRK